MHAPHHYCKPPKHLTCCGRLWPKEPGRAPLFPLNVVLTVCAQGAPYNFPSACGKRLVFSCGDICRCLIPLWYPPSKISLRTTKNP